MPDDIYEAVAITEDGELTTSGTFLQCTMWVEEVKMKYESCNDVRIVRQRDKEVHG